MEEVEPEPPSKQQPQMWPATAGAEAAAAGRRCEDSVRAQERARERGRWGGPAHRVGGVWPGPWRT
jgi:hypothetical protein